jgi:predicted O-methyltransferase YrrM
VETETEANDAKQEAAPPAPPADGRFHDEQAHRTRATAPLPFTELAEISALVRDNYPSAADGQGRAARSPSQNQYALRPDTLDFLAALLERTSPELIVEFGSGESTRLFAEWVTRHGARLVSFEHDRGWVAEVSRQLSPEQKAAVTMVHAPLRPLWRGLRQFLTYRRLDRVAADAGRAGLFLLDGPHMSGREAVLYFVLSHCRPGAIIVLDDFRHYSVREMLLGVPAPMARCFAGVPIAENSHGLYVLQCLERPPKVAIPTLGARRVLQSYWRSLRDFRQYGTGD